MIVFYKMFDNVILQRNLKDFIFKIGIIYIINVKNNPF